MWTLLCQFPLPLKENHRNTTFSRRRIENTLHGWQRRCASSPRHGLIADSWHVSRSIIEAIDSPKASSKQSLFGSWAQFAHSSGLDTSFLTEGPGFAQATARPAAKHFILELAIQNAFATRWRLKEWGKAQDVSQCRNTNLSDFWWPVKVHLALWELALEKCLRMRAQTSQAHGHLWLRPQRSQTRVSEFQISVQRHYSNPQPQMMLVTGRYKGAFQSLLRLFLAWNIPKFWLTPSGPLSEEAQGAFVRQTGGDGCFQK